MKSSYNETRRKNLVERDQLMKQLGKLQKRNSAPASIAENVTEKETAQNSRAFFAHFMLRSAGKLKQSIPFFFLFFFCLGIRSQSRTSDSSPSKKANRQPGSESMSNFKNIVKREKY